MQKLFIAMVLLLFAAGCEKDFVIKEQNAAPAMVLNSLFNDAFPLTVYLTTSYKNSGSNTIKSVADAKVELYENGILKELLVYTPSDTAGNLGTYKAQTILVAGNTYKVIASHPVYGTVSAEDAIPVGATITSATLMQYPDTDNVSSSAMLNIGLKDDGSHENYYRVNVFAYGSYTSVTPDGDTVIIYESFTAKTDPASSLTDTVREYGLVLLFSDKNFNGLQKDLTLNLRNLRGANRYTSLTVYAEVFTISKAYFDYQRTMELYQRSNYNSEPVHVYSNIQGGYGIFAAAAYKQLPFVVK
jgi:hypothetical protein